MIFIGIIGLVFLLDYLLKKRAEETLEEGTVREVAGDKILLRKLHNKGVAFGLFSGNDTIKVLGTAMLLGGLLTEFIRLVFRKGNGIAKVGYACIIGGGLSNLYDRQTKGFVTDYFSFNVKWSKLRQLVFNLSDLFILFGTLLVYGSKILRKK